ncbi:MAG: hypothetical protein ACKOVA_08170, partial [Novosphingobium sp.]
EPALNIASEVQIVVNECYARGFMLWDFSICLPVCFLRPLAGTVVIVTGKNQEGMGKRGSFADSETVICLGVEKTVDIKSR